jgi:hypothetical protein
LLKSLNFVNWHSAVPWETPQHSIFL